ncbi:MAG: hypothetical protein ACN4A7_07990 [Thermacetogeniaceae bacterium]|jgi:hypothetical protein|nr:hypothetical protein [Thermoanaerobacterales bacterium]NLN20465.1 hypothetical protein [Syntrophomonadaceae bacterium]
MGGFAYDEKALSVFKSLRPYLGPQGNGCLIALESILELLNSEPAKKTLDSLKILGPGEGFRALELESEQPKFLSPAKLFLLQALLFLADAPVAAKMTVEKTEDEQEATEENKDIFDYDAYV